MNKTELLAVKSRLQARSASGVLGEFEELAAMLIIECGDADAMYWPADLHLRDVFDKHLMREIHDHTR